MHILSRGLLVDQQVQRENIWLLNALIFIMRIIKLFEESLNEYLRLITLIKDVKSAVEMKILLIDYKQPSDNASLGLHFQNDEGKNNIFSLRHIKEIFKMKPDTGGSSDWWEARGIKTRFLMCNYRFIFCWLQSPLLAPKA